MTVVGGAMSADLAEAVRSMPCGACQAPPGEYCPSEGSHLVRWEVAAAMALVSERDYRAAAGVAGPASPGCPPGLAVVPELSGAVCAAGGHPLRWASGIQPPQWVHLDPAAGTLCPVPAVPASAPGEPCRYHRHHWLLGVPAVAIAGTVPACRRCARKHARRRS